MTVPRRSHGERTRAEILSAAVVLAAREGLQGLSIGRLSAEVGMSKGGLFAHFGSKEALQVATVDAAAEQFLAEVVGSAQTAQPGIPRLRALLDAYFQYVRDRAERGGCFFTAASLEFDDRPGPVRDRIAAVLAARTAFVEESLKEARKKRQIKGDLPQLAFEVIALTLGANVEFQLLRDPKVFARARVALERRLGDSLS